MDAFSLAPVLLLLLLGVVPGPLNAVQAAPPILTCPQEIQGMVYEYDMNIECELTSDPWIRSAFVEFYLNNSTKQEDLHAMRLGGQFDGYIFEDDKKNGKLKLRIKQLFLQDFRDYTFVVENTVGKDNATVSLVRDPSQQLDSSATVLRMTGFTVLAAVFIQLFRLH